MITVHANNAAELLRDEDQSTNVLREIFRRIAAGEDRHGEFLNRFAMMMIVADCDNFELLTPAARSLVLKYKLPKSEFYL